MILLQHRTTDLIIETRGAHLQSFTAEEVWTLYSHSI